MSAWAGIANTTPAGTPRSILHNLLTVSEAITRSAIERQESRGGHFREDYPDKDASFGTFNFVVRKGRDGRMEVSRAPIPEMPDELKRIIEEMK